MSLKSNKDENKINGPYTDWRQIITYISSTNDTMTIRAIYRGNFLSVCKSFYEMMTGRDFKALAVDIFEKDEAPNNSKKSSIFHFLCFISCHVRISHFIYPNQANAPPCNSSAPYSFAQQINVSYGR